MGRRVGQRGVQQDAQVSDLRDFELHGILFQEIGMEGIQDGDWGWGGKICFIMDMLS